MNHPEQIQHMIVFLFEEVLCLFYVICHHPQAISETWPELMLICYPCHVVGEMAICHLIYPCGDYQKRWLVFPPDRESWTPRVFSDTSTPSCLIGLLLPSGFVMSYSCGTSIGLFSFHTFIVECVPETFLGLQRPPLLRSEETAQHFKIKLGLHPLLSAWS